MRPSAIAELVLPAALWGASFLFMPIAEPHFRAVPLAALHVAGAALLLPLWVAHGALAALRTHWRPIALVGVRNSALPFLAFSFAALSISAGLSSILNANSPMFGALIAMLFAGVFLGEAVTPGMLALCALILPGTSLATGLLQLPAKA